MRLALAEIRRSKLKFLLLTGAVALLVFLILFIQTLSSALLAGVVGGIRNQSAQVLGYATSARRNPEASRVTLGQIAAAGAVPGVAVAAPFGEDTLTATGGDGTRTDITLMGYRLGGPGAPSDLTAGRLPSAPGEAVADDASVAKGFAVGDTVTTLGGVRLRIVGLAHGIQFQVQPTLFTAYPTYEEAVLAANPDAKGVKPSMIAVDVDAGRDPTAVAAAITSTVPGIDAVDRNTAVESVPGVDSISQSFNLILLVVFIVVVLVTGFFFLILTVQKLSSLTLLRAVGATTRYLLVNLAAQVVIVTVTGVLVASGLLVLATRGGSGGLDVRADPVLILGTGGAILVLALLASFGSVRRITRLDPATAARRTTGGGLA